MAGDDNINLQGILDDEDDVTSMQTYETGSSGNSAKKEEDASLDNVITNDGMVEESKEGTDDPSQPLIPLKVKPNEEGIFGKPLRSEAESNIKHNKSSPEGNRRSILNWSIEAVTNQENIRQHERNVQNIPTFKPLVSLPEDADDFVMSQMTRDFQNISGQPQAEWKGIRKTTFSKAELKTLDQRKED